MRHKQRQTQQHSGRSASPSSSNDKQAQHTESHDDGHIYHVLTCDDEDNDDEDCDQALSVSVGDATAAVTTPLPRGTSQSVSLHSRPPKQVGANQVRWYCHGAEQRINETERVSIYITIER